MNIDKSPLLMERAAAIVGCQWLETKKTKMTQVAGVRNKRKIVLSSQLYQSKTDKLCKLEIHNIISHSCILWRLSINFMKNSYPITYVFVCFILWYEQLKIYSFSELQVVNKMLQTIHTAV